SRPAERSEKCQSALGGWRMEHKPSGTVGIVDELAAGAPDEGRESRDRRLDSESVDSDQTVAVTVDCQLCRRPGELLPRPVVCWKWDVELREQVTVVVNLQA